MKFSIKSSLVLASLVGTLATSAHAETFNLGSLLSGTGPANPSFATLSVTKIGADLKFVLSAPGLDIFGASAFLGALAVDGNQTGTITGVTGGSPVAFNNGGGPGGSFDFRFDLTGPRQARLTDGESVSWTWTNANQTVASLTFAAHVQSVSVAGASSSLWYSTTPVPEPESYAMVLAGLAVAGTLITRRRTV